MPPETTVARPCCQRSGEASLRWQTVTGSVFGGIHLSIYGSAMKMKMAIFGLMTMIGSSECRRGPFSMPLARQNHGLTRPDPGVGPKGCNICNELIAMYLNHNFSPSTTAWLGEERPSKTLIINIRKPLVRLHNVPSLMWNFRQWFLNPDCARFWA